jgi:hypothetical protein
MGWKEEGISDRRVSVKRRPLILISQLPRSGGSLLSQLLDMHPELLVYPWEMKIGFPSKGFWPVLDLRSPPDRLFAALFHPELVYLARNGYQKSGKVPIQERLPFTYSPITHFREFIRQLEANPARRVVIDTYLSTLFQAWQPDRADAKYVVGFVPGMAKHRRSVSNFFEDYPDGRLISIIRHPADWFVSRRAHTKAGQVRYTDIGEQMALWNRMARLALKYRQQFREKFLLLSFKDLVSDREETMRHVCSWCGINFDACLLHQTFGGNRISPNTNFDDLSRCLSEAVLARKWQLNERERDLIDELTSQSQTKLQKVGWRR